MSDLENILRNNGDPDREELLRYLEGRASEEERFAIENQMADSEFMNDAVEGLQGFADPALLAGYTEELNRQLQKHTDKKLKRRKKRKLKGNDNWLLIAVLGILAICVAGFLIIHFYTRH